MHDAGSERARRSVRIEIRKRADRDYTRLAQFEQVIAQPDFGRQAIVCFYKNIRLEKPDIRASLGPVISRIGRWRSRMALATPHKRELLGCTFRPTSRCRPA